MQTLLLCHGKKDKVNYTHPVFVSKNMHTIDIFDESKPKFLYDL
jgi:hypothetical protein